MRQYQPNEYAILSARLTEQEMTCIEHCQVHSDCAADGECPLQERVTDIIAKESEVVG
ncbi:hypothetical protein LCGC14_0929070 [marine sediment metagenome]|uniref:Uncharacterized protein n=1 Tax=marine sediment metagenome TaxID=412755 RepID=A0A0F9R700_9ZZZZ